MKTCKHILIAALLLCAMATPAGAQARLGIRGGITVGELRFDRDIVSSDNRVGYTGGLLLDLNIPVVGLGAEVSLLYTHRNNRLSDDHGTYKRHYIDIPVYARYRLAIPGVSHIVAPYVFTGPDISILFNENAPSNRENSKTFFSWDVGGGVDLVNHLRISATYGIGISKALSYIDSDFNGNVIHGKDRHWTLCAAWLF